MEKLRCLLYVTAPIVPRWYPSPNNQATPTRSFPKTTAKYNPDMSVRTISQRTGTQQERRHHSHGLFIGLLLFAFGFRILGLTDHNVWWDEGISVWLARMPLLESIQWTAGDVHPPLYYMMLRLWVLAAGDSVFVTRYLSVLTSVLTVALIARLGHRLQENGLHASVANVGLLAASFLTVSRFSIRWAQEIRMYALAAMWATASVASAVQMWKHGGHRAWLAYVATTTAGLFTLYLNATVLAVTNLGFVILWLADRDRRRTRRWITAQATVVTILLPWLLYALPRMHSWSSDQAFGLKFFVQLYATMLAVGNPMDLQAALPFTLMALTGLVAGLIALVRRSHHAAGWGALVMLLAGVLLPPITVALISLPGLRFYFSRPLVPRYLLPLSACYYALLAWGIVALKRIRPIDVGHALSVFFTALTLAGAFQGLGDLYRGRTATDDYPSIAQTLVAHRRPEDAVLLYVDRDWPIFVAHYPGSRNDLSYGAPWDADAVQTALAPVWQHHEAVWLVTTPEAQQADPQQHVRRWLEAHAVSYEVIVSGQNTLTFYARTQARAELRGTLAPGFDPPTNVISGFGLTGATIPLTRYRTGDTVHLALTWTDNPESDIPLILYGPEEDHALQIEPPLLPKHAGPVRQLIDIPLAPDMAGGVYRITAEPPGHPPVTLTRFRLVQASAGTSLSPEDIPHRVRYRLGNSIQLIGYALPQTEFQPGESVPLTLYWQTRAPLDKRYKVFTHLLGEVFNADTETFLWGQQDNEPGAGQAQTTRWVPETIIADPYRIPVALDAPSGIYTIEVGIYGLVDGVRLPVTGPEGELSSGAIHLTTIEIQEP